MKKLFLLCAMCLMILTMPAQSRSNSKIKLIEKQRAGVAFKSSEVELLEVESSWKSLSLAYYTDLGLPSGTKWGTMNESEHYRYADAVSKFGNSLPTTSQWNELRNNCTWIWDEKENAYKVVGPNGNSIMLPCAGYRSGDNWALKSLGYGQYWSSTPDGTENAWCFSFRASKVEGLGLIDKQQGLSVRCVLNK